MEISLVHGTKKILLIGFLIFIIVAYSLIAEGKFDLNSILIVLGITIAVFILIFIPIFFLFFRWVKLEISERGIDFGQGYSGPFNQKPKNIFFYQLAKREQLFIPWKAIKGIYLLRFFGFDYIFIVKTKNNSYYKKVMVNWHVRRLVSAINTYKKGNLVKEIPSDYKPFLKI